MFARIHGMQWTCWKDEAVESLTDAQQALLRDELGRLAEYWQRLDARLHSALQLLAGIATLAVALAGVQIRSSDGSAVLTVGAVLAVVALLTALATVLLIGNQPGKLATVLAMERIRCILVDQRVDLVGLPTVGRLHVRIEDVPAEKVLDEILRNDYEPLGLVLSAGVGLLLGTGTGLMLAEAFGSVWLSAVAGMVVGVAGGLVTTLVSSKAATLLAARMARGLTS
jgi:hypothetical protein